VPEFEHEEGVEALGVIDADLFVLGDEAVDCGEVEVGGGEGVGGEEVVVEHGSEGGTEPVADGDGEAHLVALACQKPPEGRSRWTLRLLADRMVQLEYVEQVSYQTVRRALKKMNLSLG